jgi:hypothetical protein
MKNKFWLENLKSMIAMGVVGVIVLGLLYWKFFMDTGPAPPPYYMPPPPPPPAPAAGGDSGGMWYLRSPIYCDMPYGTTQKIGSILFLS